MRTLITTTGTTASTDDAEIQRCFSEAKQAGFWLDIEAPTEADYHMLETDFKFHPLSIEVSRH